MAQINKPNTHFNPVTYTGNGSTQAVTGVGFQPDWTWIKCRNDAQEPRLVDSVRGTTKYLDASLAIAELTDTNILTSFDTDGFTLGDDAISNLNGNTHVAWNWKAGGTAVSNTDGSITSSVSANTTSGFSIVKYTGTGTNSDTVGHGLGTTPSMIIAKGLDAREWYVQHQAISSGTLNLESTGAVNTSFPSGWINESPTSSVFSFTAGGGGTTNNVNNSGTDFIAYCFAEKAGFSRMGSYVGNSSNDGVFCYTGMKPSFLLIKNITASQSWWMWDNKRIGYNGGGNHRLRPNESSAEFVDATSKVDLLSNGFKFRDGDNAYNYSGNTFIYLAIAESPLVGTNGVPATAR